MLKCVICSIKQANPKDVESAVFVINGLSVCREHVINVAAEADTTSVILRKDQL